MNKDPNTMTDDELIAELTPTPTDALRLALAHYTGTEHYYRLSVNRNLIATDGVKYFADHCGNGAYWFIDIVGTELLPLLKEHPFLVIILASQDGKATISAEDGNDRALYTRNIDFTDATEGRWKFYLTDNVLLLPSEY